MKEVKYEKPARFRLVFFFVGRAGLARVERLLTFASRSTAWRCRTPPLWTPFSTFIVFLFSKRERHFFEACFEAWGRVSLAQRTNNRKGTTMKNKLNSLALFASKIDRQRIQVFFVVLSLAMLVLGVGAPDDGGYSSR